MATATIENDTSQSPSAMDEYWKTGRIVVHTVGGDAGLMRLDLDLPGFESVDDVVRRVKLVIPGETSPLSPTDATGKNGRFVISFFSSDIANAGHVPAEAVVTWELPGPIHHRKNLMIESAEQVLKTDGEEAVNIPGGDPTVVYPKTVLLMVLMALAVLIVAALLKVM
ncbi:MAG: hypothetical protein R3C59_15040 [Planctomycetaceae bacterium]